MIKRLWLRGLSFARIYRRLILIERSLSQPFPEVSAGVPVRVTVLARSEIDAYMAFRPDQDAAEVRRRLDEGHRCFAVWHEQQIIHAAWTVTRQARIEYLSREIELASDQIYLCNAFTAPAFRGLGASPVRIQEVVRYFRDRGYRQLLSALRPENRAVFRQWDKLGYRRLGTIGYIGLDPFRRAFYRAERGRLPP